MDQSVFNEITQLIDALRAETTVNSISPERMGALLQRIVDILPDLDDSEIGNAAHTALEAAQAAVNLAQSALDNARTASATASDAAGNDIVLFDQFLATVDGIDHRGVANEFASFGVFSVEHSLLIIEP